MEIAHALPNTKTWSPAVMTRTSGGGREGAEDAVDTVDVKEGGWGPREERCGGMPPYPEGVDVGLAELVGESLCKDLESGTSAGR